MGAGRRRSSGRRPTRRPVRGGRPDPRRGGRPDPRRDPRRGTRPAPEREERRPAPRRGGGRRGKKTLNAF